MKTQKFDLESLEVKRLSSALGAEIRGIKLATLDAAGASAVENLLIEHKILLFPDQALSVDEHVTFGSLFGDRVLIVGVSLKVPKKGTKGDVFINTKCLVWKQKYLMFDQKIFNCRSTFSVQCSEFDATNFSSQS